MHETKPAALPGPTRWLQWFVVLQSVTLPALGIPMFFRNEAGWHYLLWRDMPFLQLFDGFMGNQSSMTNAVVSRPLVRALEWAQVRVFDLEATWYIVVNGALFAGFALALFHLTRFCLGVRAAAVSGLLLMAAFSTVYYPVLNAIYGLQYPLEMLLVCAALLVFARSLRGRPGLAWLGVVLSLLAFVTHAASILVIPLVLAVLALTTPGLAWRWRVVVAGVSPLAIGLLPLIERFGIPGGLMEQPSLDAKAAFLVDKLNALGALLTRQPTGVLLWGTLAFAALRAWMRGWSDQRVLLVAIAAAIPLMLLADGALAAVVMGALLLLALVRERSRWWIATWAAIGAGIYIASGEKAASYMRHLTIPLVLVGSDAAVRMLAALWAPAAPRLGGLGRIGLVGASGIGTAVYLALFTAGALGAVPVLSDKLAQVTYVRDLSLVFRDALRDGLALVPASGSLAMYRGRSRDAEMQSLYGEDYFARLQPAKDDHYEEFVAMLGRPDVQLDLLDPDGVGPPAARALVAVNDWEIGRTRKRCACEPAAILARGRARAGVFVLDGSEDPGSR